MTTPKIKARLRYGERPGIAYLFLSPWMAGALLLTIGPMLASLYLSFTNYDLFTAPTFQKGAGDTYVWTRTGTILERQDVAEGRCKY